MKIADGLTEAVRNTPLIRLRRASGLTRRRHPRQGRAPEPGRLLRDGPPIARRGRRPGRRSPPAGLRRMEGAGGAPGVNPSCRARLRESGAREGAGDRKGEGGE